MSVLRVFSRSERRDRRDSSSLPYSQTRRASRAPEKSSWNFSTFFNFITSLGFGSKSEDDVEEDEEMCDEHVIQIPEDDIDMNLPANSVEKTDDAKPATVLPSGVSSVAIPSSSQVMGDSTSNSDQSASSSNNALYLSSDDSVIAWAVRKFESQTPMNETDYCALKTFLEKRRKRLFGTYEPEKLHFVSDEPSTSSNRDSDACTAQSSSQAASKYPTSLPTFRNTSAARASSARKRMVKRDYNGSIFFRSAARAPETMSSQRHKAASIPEASLRGTSTKRPRVDEETSNQGVEPEVFPAEISKRRRLHEDTSNNGVASVMSTSHSAPVLGSAGGVAGLSARPRLPRANGIRPRTAPLVSSPLRNVVSSSPPASPPRTRAPAATAVASANASTSAKCNPTFSATFLSEVIEKATPRPKQSDVANPYQTAAPIKPVYKPMERKRMSELRARTRQAEKEKELAKAKESRKKELTAKDIIEATVPKGAKRSRPPAGLNKAKAVNGDVRTIANGVLIGEPVDESSPRKKKRSVTVEEVFEDDDGRNASSYAKPAGIIQPQGPAFVHARPPPIFVPSNHSAPSLNAKGSTLGKSSIPKEPSKLRTSFLPDEEENEIPADSVPLRVTPPSMTTPSAPLAEVQEKKSPKEIALSLPVSELPTFVFKAPSALSPADHSEARDAAKALPVSALPKFDFSKTHHLVNGVKSSVSTPVVKAFDFAAAGLKPAAPPTNGQWQCSSCMLQNPSSAVEKCTICDAPRPGVERAKKATTNGTHPPATQPKATVPAPAVKAFDFAAAGLKAPKPVSDGKWQCSSCMLENPASASEKCTICDAPRPGAEKQPAKPSVSKRTPAPAAAPKAFDWAAAGLAPKAKNGGESWTCGTCMLSNPASVTEKCNICDAPRS